MTRQQFIWTSIIAPILAFLGIKLKSGFKSIADSFAMAIYKKSFDKGNRFWVDSNTGKDRDGYGKSPNKAFATRGYALDQCNPRCGDVVFFMPGVEPITEGIIIPQNTHLIGIGEGKNRPSITWA